MSTDRNFQHCLLINPFMCIVLLSFSIVLNSTSIICTVRLKAIMVLLFRLLCTLEKSQVLDTCLIFHTHKKNGKSGCVGPLLQQ